MAFEVFGVDVQDMPHAAVADSMATDLIASIVGFLADMVIEVVAFHHQTSV